jgi:pSer/pThr/pTyr-binding forkhead associated (FHA) protein
MDEARATSRPSPLRQTGPAPIVPADFKPLTLVLVPTGVRVEINKPDMLVGRHSEADVRLPLADVSRRHCRFVYLTTGWQVVDLNSLNGVFVNNKRVERSHIRHGDRIRIGGFMFDVEIAGASKSGQRRAS